MGIYALRAATGFFVAAVVPVVSALVAEHTAGLRRARRFAWLGAMSLLGFLFGPALNLVARWVGSWVGDGTISVALTAQAVIVLSAFELGIVLQGQLHIGTSPREVAMMIGDAYTRPRRYHPMASGRLTTTPSARFDHVKFRKCASPPPQASSPAPHWPPPVSSRCV